MTGESDDLRAALVDAECELLSDFLARHNPDPDPNDDDEPRDET